MSLRHENGELVLGATRGDGAEDKDVTANIRTLEDVPKGSGAAMCRRSARCAARST